MHIYIYIHIILKTKTTPRPSDPPARCRPCVIIGLLLVVCLVVFMIAIRMLYVAQCLIVCYIVIAFAAFGVHAKTWGLGMLTQG